MTEHFVRVSLLPDGRVFIQPYSFTENGFRIGDGLPMVLPDLANSDRLGAALTEALNASNQRALPARDLRADPPDREFLAWLGVRTYSQYMRGVRSVSLRAIYDQVVADVTITPSRNAGPGGGFTAIADEQISVMYESPEQLGRAVQEAMAKATTV